MVIDLLATTDRRDQNITNMRPVVACHHKSYKLKPLMRKHRLYELAVYSGNKMLFRFRDSLNLIYSSKKLDILNSFRPL